jgi:hypothetical protein
MKTFIILFFISSCSYANGIDLDAVQRFSSDFNQQHSGYQTQEQQLQQQQLFNQINQIRQQREINEQKEQSDRLEREIEYLRQRDNY